MKYLAFILLLLPFLGISQIYTPQVKITDTTFDFQFEGVTKAAIDSSGIIRSKSAIHANFFCPDSTISYSFTTDDVWQKLTNDYDSLYSTGEEDGITINYDTLIVGSIGGDWDGFVKLNFEGSNGVTYKIRFFNITQSVGYPVGGAETARGSGNLVKMFSSPYIYNLNPGDKIIIQVQTDNDSGDITIRSSNIKLYYIHD